MNIFFKTLSTSKRFQDTAGIARGAFRVIQSFQLDNIQNNVDKNQTNTNGNEGKNTENSEKNQEKPLDSKEKTIENEENIKNKEKTIENMNNNLEKPINIVETIKNHAKDPEKQEKPSNLTSPPSDLILDKELNKNNMAVIESDNSFITTTESKNLEIIIDSSMISSLINYRFFLGKRETRSCRSLVSGIQFREIGVKYFRGRNH